MGMTDPIADMLTRIRNANQAKHEKVEMSVSKTKLEILEVIKKEGYIQGYEVLERELKNHRMEKYILVTLKYTDKKERVIKGITRISKPGLRIYAKAEDMPKVFNGLGIAIVSTSNGVMTDREARKLKIGGEVMAYVW
ncbi:MAG: 30S ribosomal protein S8 [Coprobacillus sp.]|nr:30S ribosomal protein S8 [Coprobacillus sp.]MDY4145935.1 30S ribosomal protein S8 [Bacilli bacterium]CCY08437.1 30S ribosomal protein S8 [Coprobacillus sp. CAG:698]